MLTLSELNNTQKPQLVELSPPVENQQVFNSDTVSNVAAHAALLADPSGVLKTYSSIAAELSTGPNSTTLDMLLKQNENLDKAANYDELQKILRDPNIGNDEKRQYMDGYINLNTAPMRERSLSSLVGQQSKYNDVTDANDETLDTTVYDSSTILKDLSAVEDGADAYRGWVQNAVNTQTALKTRDGFNVFLDVVEGMIPFLDQASVAKTKLAMSKGDAAGLFKTLVLMGDSKKEVRDAIRRMPVADRYKFAQKLIDVVKGTGGSFTVRPNELSVVNQLNSYLVSGTYTDSDAFLDNIFSAMDVIMPVTGWIGKALKGVKGAKAAAVVTERAAQAEARLGQAADVAGEAITPQTLPAAGNRDLNLTPKGGRRAATGYETGVQGPNRPLMDEIDDAMQESTVNRLSVRTNVNHISVAQTLKDSNPTKARQVNNLIEADKSGQAARILAGTTRDDAIADVRLAEVANPNGAVRNKIEMDEAGPNPDRAIVDSVIQDQGMIHLSKEAKILTRDKIKNAFRDVIGLVPRRSMATVGREITETADTPRGVAFDMIYGPKDGGFVDAQQGLKQVLIGLSKYGVTGDEVEILAKGTNGLYVPIKGVPLQKGNYLIRVKHDYTFTPGDVIGQALIPGSRYNMFDSRSSITNENAGSILDHIVPFFSRIESTIFNSASAASETSAKVGKQLLSLGKVFAQKYKKLDKRQKTLLDLYRIEANDKGIKFSVSNLRARGFSEDAIDAMRSWKTTTDTMFVLENMDVNKTLRLRGWERLVDQVNDTDLVVKSLPNRGMADGVKAYDPETNSIRTITKAEIDDLYAKGGKIVETRSPAELGDETFTKVFVKQNTEGAYTRRINDNDPTLSYRDGYYPIRYTDPIFITKKFIKDGIEWTKSVATSGTFSDAKQLIARLRATDAEGVYDMRPNLRKGSQEYEDAEWSSIVASGRSTQRVRGARLENATGQTDLNHVHVESPEESLVNSIRSLAARTAWRDWVENTKARWLSQHGDLVEKVDGYKVLWPEDPRKIGGSLEVDSQRIKDAKATWKFINTMENGYVNILDDYFKNFFRQMSTDIGQKSWGWLDGVKPIAEKVTSKLAGESPSRFVRRRAFRLLLAANPLRQLPVQAMQALPVLMATNPLAIPKISMQMILLDYLKNGGDADSFMKVMAKKATGMDAASAKQLAKDWEASGFEAAVDAHTLIRDQMNNLVDRTWWAKTKGVVGAPIDFLQKKGFNAGETILMRSVWLSEYDLAKKAGKVMDAETLQEIGARVRNLTLNMNKAGELPYNQNLFSAAFQFFQAPHKAFAQIVFGHKGLTWKDRRQLGASYLLTYGLGGGWITDMLLGATGNTDQDTRDLVEGGLFNLTLNSALTSLYGDEVSVDFSDSLRVLPLNEALNFEFFQSLMGSEVSEVLSNSASASLVFGSNPRLTNFVRQMMRPFIVDWDKKPEELFLTGKSFLTIFSGASNVFKAMYAMQYEKSITAKGRVIDYHVNDLEALAKIAGFNTVDEIHQYASDEEMYKKSGKYKDDIKLLVDETSARLASKGISNEEAGYYMDMMAEAQRVFNNDPFYMEEFANQIKYKALAGENSMYQRLRSMAGYMDYNEFEKLVMSNPSLTPDAQKTLLDGAKMLGNK